MVPRRSLSLGLVAALAAGFVAFALLRPEPPERRFRAGLDAVSRQDLDAASKAIDSLRDEPGFESHHHLLRAGHALRAGRPRDALSRLTFVRAHEALRVPAALYRGEALYRLGRLMEAEQVLLRLDRDGPDHPEVCRWLAAIYYDVGAMNHAVVRLEQLARLEPGDYAPHRLLGTIHLDFERYPQAIRHFEEALKRSPPEPVRAAMVRDRSRAMVRDRRYLEALEALRGEAEDADVLAMRCECQWNLGRREEAWRTWARASEIAPDDRGVLVIGARMRSDEGKPEEAVPLLRRALDADPHDTEARYQLAMTYRQLGREEEFRRESGRKEESQELRDRLTQLSLKAMEEPRNAAVRDDLAEVCRRLGKAELAAMWTKAAEDCRRFETGSRP